MKITYEYLEKHHACAGRLSAFREKFPDGATEEEAGAWATVEDLRWVVRYAPLEYQALASAALLARPDLDLDSLRCVVLNAPPEYQAKARTKLTRRAK